MPPRALPTRFYEGDKCFFDLTRVCAHYNGSTEHIHYCRDCKYLPELSKFQVNGLKGTKGEYFNAEYCLLIAIGSSREIEEKKHWIHTNSRKVPKWAKDLVAGKDGWLDHPRYLYSEEGGFRIFYEPYGISSTDIKWLDKVCEKYDLHYLITGLSSHYPGRCVRVELYRNKKDEEN